MVSNNEVGITPPDSSQGSHQPENLPQKESVSYLFFIMEATFSICLFILVLIALFAFSLEIQHYLQRELPPSFVFNVGEGVWLMPVVFLMGGVCIFNQCDFFLFPFALGIIFIISVFTLTTVISFLLRNSKVFRYRSRALVILNLMTFAIIIGIVVVTHTLTARNQSLVSADVENFYKNHHFSDPITSGNTYIYHETRYYDGRDSPTGKIVTSKIDGSEKRILHELPDDIFIESVSPLGTHIIANGKVYKLADFNINKPLVVVKERDQHWLYGDPIICEWAPSGRYVACLLEGYPANELLLVDLATGRIGTIYEKKPLTIDSIAQQEGFSWDESDNLYLDMDRQIYKIPNIDPVVNSNFSASFNKIPLTDRQRCYDSKYYNSKIYCLVHIEDIGESQNWDSQYLTGRQFMFSQSLNGPVDWEKVSPVPISADSFVIINDKFALALMGSGKAQHTLINMENGKIREIWRSYHPESVISIPTPASPSDISLIFDRDKYPFPVVYKGQ